MAKSIKTLAMKLLEGKRIPFETRVYETDTRDAELIAERLSIPPEAVFKTLVIKPPGGQAKAKPMLILLAANQQLNLKKLAKAVGAKKLKMATHREAEAMTGLQVGGISPLALMNKGFAIYLDESAKDQSKIFISSGQRGLQIHLAVVDLVKIVKAKYVDVGEL
ncbi:MAG: aminoacyl-tRNA deacylase [Chloroflexi bacterium]|nr:aminoacyl-tRNA deacylase [Chloroflexota bacterium]